jgi:hypothetical protein
MVGVMILKCTCKHPFQDAKYGEGMRLHTASKKDGEPPRCTVCKRRWKMRMKALAESTMFTVAMTLPNQVRVRIIGREIHVDAK